MSTQRASHRPAWLPVPVPRACDEHFSACTMNTIWLTTGALQRTAPCSAAPHGCDTVVCTACAEQCARCALCCSADVARRPFPVVAQRFHRPPLPRRRRRRRGSCARIHTTLCAKFVRTVPQWLDFVQPATPHRRRN
jgi:hypothetical protein